ncbi:MAG TPA: glycosyltransferase family 2 protein [Alphaproteobacteria bacterium]
MPSSILLFIPAYNCAPQIGRTLAQIDARTAKLIDEVIVIDNRSTDATVAAARAAAARLDWGPVRILRNRENYGLGGSHKVAFAWALERAHSHLAVLHGDDQGRIADLLPLIQAGAHESHDCLLGARFAAGSRLVGYAPTRILANRAFDLLFSLACGRRLYDLGAGLNLYRTAILGDRFYARFPDDLTFNYCMMLAHAHLGHRFRFFPIEWREEDQVSNVRALRQAARMLALLAGYVAGPDRFLAAEHRAVARASYPFDEVTDSGR